VTLNVTPPGEPARRSPGPSDSVTVALVRPGGHGHGICGRTQAGSGLVPKF
jgi:hypothetical protein